MKLTTDLTQSSIASHNCRLTQRGTKFILLRSRVARFKERSVMSDLHLALTSALTDRYTSNATRVRELAAPLIKAQFWQKPFPYGNSFGHLVLHLTGNLNYYIGAQIAQTGYIRDRSREFNDPNPPPKDQALQRFDDAIAMVLETIRAQSSDDWAAPYSAVGTTAPTRLDIVIVCAAHMQHHIGQMIYLGYQWKQAEPK
jgi:hypothetical protein